jgi:predicted MFS family arabinose efflux permease
VHYKLLEPRFYRERIAGIMDDMSPVEATRYVVRALIAAAVVPLPQHAGTRLLQAYMPEHALWLLMLALFPVGIYAGVRRHPTATLIIAGYVTVMFVGIALRSGNVGTLVRHRGLIVPFVVCLSAVALCHLLARWSRQPSPAKGLTDGVD